MTTRLGPAARAVHAAETIVSGVTGVRRTVQRAHLRAAGVAAMTADPVDARHEAVNAAIDVVVEDLGPSIDAARDLFSLAGRAREWAKRRRGT